MILNDVLSAGPPRKARKRVGRGIGSGNGKTAGRGHKGQKSRSGGMGGKAAFEGGTMPLFRRMPRRGFNNARFRDDPFAVVNLGQVDRAFESGETVSLETLLSKGLTKKGATRVKILGQGELRKQLRFEVAALSASAKAKIEAASGTIQEI